MKTRILQKTAKLVLAALLASAMLEGLLAFATACRRWTDTRPIAERLHTRYDPTLGWINRPNLILPDLYGPDRGLSTGSNGFRNSGSPAPDSQTRPIRILCSGDSFTFGFGVSDAHAWPALLARREPHFETINLAVGGYGIDQALLLYEQVADRLPHNVHLFAFITPSIARAFQSDFLGYAKPLFEIEDSSLQLTHVPVPRYPIKRLAIRLNSALADLHITRLLRHLLRPHATAPQPDESDQPDQHDLLAAILQRVHDSTTRFRAQPIFLYLPTLFDVRQDNNDLLRQHLLQLCASNNWTFLDFTDEFRALPPPDAERLFIREGEVRFAYSAGHYNEAGNAFVADLLHDRLGSNNLVRCVQSTSPAPPRKPTEKEKTD